MVMLGKKILIYLTILTTISQSVLAVVDQALAADPPATNSGDDIDWIRDENFDDNWEPDPEFIKRNQPTIPDSILEFENSVVPPSNTNTDINSAENTASTNTSAYDRLFNYTGPKIIFNPQDAEDIRKLTCIATMIPDYENDFLAIAEATGNSNIAFYADLKKSDPERFKNIVTDLKAKKENALKEDLLKPEYRSQLTCILNLDSIQEADQMVLTAKSDPDSIVQEQIRLAIDTLKIDVRTLKMLNYLVTDKNKGGAGHNLIKVSRLRKGYTLPNRIYDRESEAVLIEKAQKEQQAAEDATKTVGEAQQEADDQNITSGQILESNTEETNTEFAITIGDEEHQVVSAHAEGQAVDISAVDDIRCTLIKKRRLGGDSKTMLPAKPIELMWQTEEGYNGSAEAQRDSVNALVNGLYKDGILDLLEELDVNIDDIDDLSSSNLGDILGIVGQSLVGQLINQNGKITGQDLTETLKMVGAVYLADKLDIPRAALYGAGYKTIDDLQVNLGRATVEKKLNLPFGSLAGNTAPDVFYSVGQRKMEKELELPIGTLTSDITTEKELMIHVGASLLEDKLSLNRGSFLKPTFKEIREAAGTKKFDIIFSMPQVVDTRLNMEGGYAQSFKDKTLSPSDFLTKIAFKHLADHAYVFASFIGCEEFTVGPNRGCKANNVSTSKRDAAFNTPEGTIDDFLVGNMASLIKIGRYEIVKKISNRDEERMALMKWLEGENALTTCHVPDKIGATITIDADPPKGKYEEKYIEMEEAFINGRLGLKDGDFYSIFGCPLGGADTVFSRVGGTALLEAIKNSPDFQKAQTKFLNENPEIAKIINTVEFYLDRFKAIDTHLDIIDKELEALASEPEAKDIYDQYKILKDKVKGRKGDSIKIYQDLAKENKVTLGILRTKASALSRNDKFKQRINKILLELDKVSILIQEIITGEVNEKLTDFKFSEVGVNDDKNNNNSAQPEMTLKRAIWLLVTGKATVEDILVSMGGGKIEDELGLPANTFFYFVQSIKQANKKPGDELKKNPNYLETDGKLEKERFLASIGQAAVEEAMNLTPDSFRGKGMPDPRVNDELSDVVAHMAEYLDLDTQKTKDKLKSGFGSSVSLDLLMSGDTAAWSQAKRSFDQFDNKLYLKDGTTQSFITGRNISFDSKTYLSIEELDLVSAKLNIDKSALLKLTKVLSGEDKWQVNPISYQSYNPYISDATASAGTCATLEDVYSYVDQDGKHTFATREQAIAYFQAHKDRQLDYIGQIVQGIMTITGGTVVGEAIAKQMLTNYLKDFDVARAFPTDVLAQVAETSGVSIEILNRLFARTDKDNDLFKYLVTVGEKVGERRMASALFGHFGVSIGGQKIGINDIFNILNGDGPSTINRIAGSFLDERLGFTKGTFAQILNAPTSAVRECLMKEAGADYLLRLLGIKGVNITGYGNPYNALGGGKIESVLNWPTNTFKGDSPKDTEDKRAGLMKLIDNVGASRFVDAFKIPLAGLNFQPFAQKLFPDEKLDDIKKLSNRQIMDRLDLLEAQSSLEDTNVYDARKQINEIIYNRLQYIQDENSIIWKYENKELENRLSGEDETSATGDVQIDENSGPYTGPPLRLPDFVINTDNAMAAITGAIGQSVSLAKEILIFRQRLESIDYQVGHQRGDTKNLILGKTTPDSYRNYVSQTQATVLAAMKLGELLGVEPEKVKAATEIFTLFREKGSSWDTDWNPRDRASFYGAFTTIFELNLDEKAKFRDGTFKKIFMYPEKAKNILIAEGLYRLDQSIFKSNRKYSLERIFLAKVDGINITDCDVSGGQLHSCQKVEVFNNQAAVAEGANQLATYIYETSGESLELSAPEVKLFLAQFFRSGNIDVLQALANAELAKRINIFKDKTLTLPGGFKVTWGDIVGAILGNSELEEYAANLAEAQALAELDNADFATQMANFRETEPTQYETAGGYGVSGQLDLGDAANPYTGIVTQDNNPRDIDDQVTRNINNNYQLPAGGVDVDSLRTKYYTPPNVYDYPPIETEAGAIFNFQYYYDMDAYLTRLNFVSQRREEAKDKIKKMYQKNLQYHYVDSLLFQQDPNIPPGFAAAMFEGNNRTRANALLVWVKNGVLRGKFLGTDIKSDWVPVLSYLIDQARVGGEEAFKNFVVSGEINKFDGILRREFDQAFGISLVEGTFTSIIAGWKNGGNFKDDYSFTSGTKKITMKSLQNIYKEHFQEKITGWIDKQLGLDVGSTLKMYKAYKGYAQARAAYTAAVAAHAAAAAKLAVSKTTEAFAQYRQSLAPSPENLANLNTAQQAVTADTAAESGAQMAADAKKTQLTQIKAEFISFIITTIFEKQLLQLDEALGLVPGSSAMLVGMAVNWVFGLGITPYAIVLFVALNLFGYYKTEVRCTADGYYPKVEKIPSDAIRDNGHLGEFDGMNVETKKKEFVKAAQYKARTLLGNVLDMPAKFDDQRMTPSQIMVGRTQDVDAMFSKTAQVIYKYTGLPDPKTGVLPSRAGVWYNPQTTAYTHIGF